MLFYRKILEIAFSSIFCSFNEQLLKLLWIKTIKQTRYKVLLLFLIRYYIILEFFTNVNSFSKLFWTFLFYSIRFYTLLYHIYVNFANLRASIGTTMAIRIFFMLKTGCEDKIWTCDLRDMTPTSWPLLYSAIYYY